uniref:Uncharacterized protein n=1 Tax=Anguilla anguilla TaxID=7936 RepID=A0A0E9XCL2_ANGAN
MGLQMIQTFWICLF